MTVEYACPRASIALCCPRAWSSNLLQIQAPLISNPENRENDIPDRNEIRPIFPCILQLSIDSYHWNAGSGLLIT
jgi:hypothetical protein